MEHLHSIAWDVPFKSLFFIVSEGLTVVHKASGAIRSDKFCCPWEINGRFPPPFEISFKKVFEPDGAMAMPKLYVIALLAALLAGCASQKDPENNEAASLGESYSARYRSPADALEQSSGFIDAQRCRGAELVGMKGAGASKGEFVSNLGVRGAEILSIGDLVEVFVEQDETFTGSYVVGVDGNLRLPFAKPVRAVGRTPAQI